MVQRVPLDTDYEPPTSVFSTSYYPWVDSWSSELLYAWCQSEKCKAIGETGLDKRYPLSPQIELFDIHIEISQTVNKPLIIHCVKAYNEVLERLRFHNYHRPVLFHGYNKSYELAKQLIAKGHILSFGAAILNHSKLYKTIQTCPLSQLAIESDNNKYLDIEVLYSHIASIRTMDVAQLTLALQTNFKTFYTL